MKCPITILAHLPLLRIEEDSIPFVDGTLWQMPFEQYDALSLGAYSDHRSAYEKTAPVFYTFDISLDLPFLREGLPAYAGAIELKIRSDDFAFLERLNLGFLLYFHQVFVDQVWKALLLAAPATVLPIPRHSVTFAVPTGDKPAYFHIPKSMIGELIRIQGDADNEYLFMHETAVPAVSIQTIEHARSLVPVVRAIAEIPPLNAALEVLASTTVPSLSPTEQLTLSVAALEELLLPDVRTQLTATFSRRLAALTGTDEAQRKAISRMGRLLYKSRSALVHGEKIKGHDDRIQTVNLAYGQQALAAVITAYAHQFAAGNSLKTIRQQLDQPSTYASRRIDLANPEGLRHPDRLLRKQISDTAGFTVGAAPHANEGYMVSWAPLLGMHAPEAFVFGENPAPVVIPLNGLDVLSMEDKDISRDHISQLRTNDRSVACLTIGVEDSGNYGSREPNMYTLHRQRNLAVIALRLSGFYFFHDPELLGAFIYQGKHRLRQGSIFRQTLLNDLKHDPQSTITPIDIKRIGLAWRMLDDYHQTASHPDADHVLTLYRRSFDKRFQPYFTRAGLMLSALEAMLGRFRRWKDPVQLEDLVLKAAGESEAVDWFKKKGRAFRNAIAHGSWEPVAEGESDPVNHLQNVLTDILPAYLTCWLNLEDRTDKRPGPALIEALDFSA